MHGLDAIRPMMAKAFYTVALWPNTNLSKDKRQEHYIDSLPHLMGPFIRQSASFLVFECGKIKIIISSFAAIIMQIGYGIVVQRSLHLNRGSLRGLWHYGSHLSWHVSHFEMCTELVSRCRFPKEGWALEDLPTWWPEYLFFAYKNNWHKFFFWELVTHELQCLVCMIT